MSPDTILKTDLCAKGLRRELHSLGRRGQWRSFDKLVIQSCFLRAYCCSMPCARHWGNPGKIIVGYDGREFGVHGEDSRRLYLSEIIDITGLLMGVMNEEDAGICPGESSVSWGYIMLQ